MSANKLDVYYVKKGKSVTSMKGILSEGMPVTEEDFKGGKDSIEALLKPRTNGKGTAILGKKKPVLEIEEEVKGTPEAAKENSNGASKK